MGHYFQYLRYLLSLGGDAEISSNKHFLEIIAKSALSMIEKETPEYDKIALGIGGTHYPERFTNMALSGEYAFSHIMSKYYAENFDMIEQAIERSDIKAEIAVIEWKSIKAVDRDMITKELDRLGLDYERA